MLFVYPAVFHNDSGAYWVEFPDLKGCQSYGDNIGDTMENAQEALAGYLLTLLDDGENCPVSSDVSSIKCDDDSFVSLVSCDIINKTNSKSVKKTLTIPGWLNDRANSMGINFSQTLQEALLEKIRNIQ